MSASNPGRGKGLFPGRGPKGANAIHSELVRERIRTKAIVNRLTNHVLGRIEMSATQVTAALGLIRKTVPDLQAIEHSGEVAQPVHKVSAEPPTEAEWQQQYGGSQHLNG
jgi:hypothetical protein